MKKFFIILLFYSHYVMAKSDINLHKNRLTTCTITKSTINDYEPQSFEQSNNLLKKPGYRSNNIGKEIIIKGIILDEKCVPVQDAKIYLWQVGNDGKYPYKIMRSNISSNMQNLKSPYSFTGSGIATTNNNGEFWFITLYPKINNNVNVRVEHRSLKTLQTNLSLSKPNLNNYNPIEDAKFYEAMKHKMQIYNFTLVLKGKTLKKY